MSSTIHQPSGMQCYYVSQYRTHIKRTGQGFVQHKHRNHCRNDEAENWHHFEVMSVFKCKCQSEDDATFAEIKVISRTSVGT